MIGLIFGETDFPKYILKKIKNKHNYIIIDLTRKKFFKKEQNSYSVSIGEFGKIISILKLNNCKRQYENSFIRRITLIIWKPYDKLRRKTGVIMAKVNFTDLLVLIV